MKPTILTISLLSLSTLYAGHRLQTVEEILQPPALKDIQRALESRGGTFTPASGEQIQLLVQEILQGTYTPSSEGKGTQSHQVSLKEITTFLTSMPCTALSKSLFKQLNSQLPSLVYSSLMKRLLEAGHAAHSVIAAQKETIALHDKEMESSPLLRTAHALALETVMGLLFIMASPHSHPCERMHALYLINTVHLCGSRGIALERFGARANRFYFTYDGMLREYDPSKSSAKIPKHVKAFARFMKAVSHSKSQYLSYLNKGIEHGIILLKTYYEQASQENWIAPAPGFVWRYAASLFKEITTLDVIAMRTINPEKILAHRANKDLMSLMLHCSLRTAETHESLKKAQELIIIYKNEHAGCPYVSIMEQYLKDTCKRYKNPS